MNLKLPVYEASPEKAVRIPTPEELKAMCLKANPTIRFLLLGFAQSGISLQDFLKLRYGSTGNHIYGSIGSQLKSGRQIIHLPRHKTKYWYDTFLGFILF